MLASLKKKIKRRRKQAALISGRDPGNRSQRRLTQESSSQGSTSDNPTRQQSRQQPRQQSKRRQRKPVKAPAEFAEGGLKTDAQGRTLFPVKTPDGQVEYRSAKTELLSGRTLFPVRLNGKLKYVPAQAEATSMEKSLGVFVRDDAVTQPSVAQSGLIYKDSNQQTLDTISELGGQNRMLFAVERTDPNTNQTTKEYFPAKSEATPQELSQGRYIDEKEAISQTILNRKPRVSRRTGHPLIATQLDDGSVVYLPRRSQATAQELLQGRYVEDETVKTQVQVGIADAMTNGRTRYDRRRDRKLFPVRAKEDNHPTALLYAVVRRSNTSRDDPRQAVFYLPRESEATDQELAQGFYLPDTAVDKRQNQRRYTALRDDPADRAQRRSQRAQKISAHKTPDSTGV